LLLHGTADTDVPYELSVAMAAALERAGIEHDLITIEDGEHGFDHVDPPTPSILAAWDRVHDFLARFCSL